MMIGFPVADLTTMTTRGASPEAVYVDDWYAKVRQQMQDTLAVGMRREAFDEVLAVANEASAVGWDGEGGLPVQDETVCHAQELLKALPLGTRAPSIGVEPDGFLTLEWYKSPTRVLSVSVGPDEALHFAALIGSSAIHGTTFFVGEGRKELIDRIEQIERD